LLATCCGLFPIGLWEALFRLLLGWAFFLARVIPKISPGWDGILVGVICLILLAFGLHRFLSWLHKARLQGEMGPSWDFRRTLALLAFVVLLFAAGIAVVGTSHQLAWMATSREPLFHSSFRTAVARTQSQNNLKQMVIGVHNYAGAHDNTLPGTPLHSWQTDLLPFMEQEGLFARINRQLPWTHPDNQAAFATEFRPFLHPFLEEKSAHGYALSHYAGNVHVFGAGPSLSLKDLERGRGTSNTIFGGEVGDQFRAWGDPRNVRDPALGLNRAPNGFATPIEGQPVLFMMGDGSVRSFRGDTDPEFLESISNPRR